MGYSETELSLHKTTTNRYENYLQIKYLSHYIFITLPQVKKLLTFWQNIIQKIPNDSELHKQALSSINNKAFHCQGGAVFAVPYPEWEDILLRFIVAYQTLCDYLDNLCDRVQYTDGLAFLKLHQSLLDALTPGVKPQDYYSLYPYKNDNNYINNLVLECQSCIKLLPSYNVVYENIITLADYYINLQVKKHIELNNREKELISWAKSKINNYDQIYWQEFSAASGSTLALFALIGLSTRKDISCEQSNNIFHAYFPWICGLHILLDYFIDQEEDLIGGDLNFTFYYKNNEEMKQRLKFFLRQSYLACNDIFQKTVIEGLLAMYLSDKKIKNQGFNQISYELLNESGNQAWLTYKICSIVRKFL